MLQRGNLTLHLVLLGFITWALSGCGISGLPDTLPPRPELPVIPPAEVSPLPGEETGLLLVRDETGNLLLMDQHGLQRQSLTADASARVHYRQPTWSTTGEWIAWVRTEQSSASLQGTLEIARPTGEIWLRGKVPFPPFYLYWNGNSTQLSFLSNWLENNRWTLGLNVLVLDRQEESFTAKLVGTGQPFYYVWGPAGKQLLIHQSLSEVYRQQGEDVFWITDTAARFGAPQWSADGQFVLYGDTQDGVATLLQDYLDTGQVRVLNYFQGKHLALFLNATGNLLAVTETPETWSVNALGPLYLYDLEGRTVQEVTAEPVIAAFWSPNGSRLLFYEVDRQAQVPTIRQRIWEGDAILDLGTIIPPPVFLQRYLPFSDQYALSHRLWSPDSQHIVFTTQEPNGRNAIYVQEVKANSEPEFLTHGDLAFWSHQ